MKNQPIEKPAPKKRAKRAPKAFLIENGVWTEFICTAPKKQKLSKADKWLRDHKPLFQIVDMRAVLK
ncbi:MAG: hypothetical protein LBP75_08600 [Planctomycetota bacterium]|nr:hypothetical protein [Planctomycetota bacterium]